ncbi:helix-turn-helix domain-containing protein [Hydrogenophaga sp.]|uniref:helix-turn-helix domain-containing protein n=1 Tax=Hydrogenophaga sp. TaxID=1904254 RepID=UPI0025C23CEC|nr:helix-turn-helix domain-containing protein [Hydrogenophaga sp.]MBT9465561.1 helix-turn-helix domain-containing protein [Hydrogenophaga sp.]
MALKWSTECVPPAQRFDQWREACRHHVYALSPERRTRHPFQGSIARHQLGMSDVIDIVCEGHLVQRREEDIHDSPGDTYCVYLQRRGSAWFEQQGQRCVAEAGDIVFVDPHRAFSTGTAGDFDFRLWRIERARLRPLLATRSGEMPMRRMGSGGASELIASWLDTLLHQHEKLSPNSLDLACNTLCALVADAAGAHPDQRDSSRLARRQALLQRVKRHVEQHSSDMGLTPASVAATFGVSVRTLHQLFTLSDGSFHEYLTSARLGHAHALLRDPQALHMDTAGIGFAAGFGEVSTFYRRFKQRYGMTPSECRWHDVKSHDGASTAVPMAL